MTLSNGGLTVTPSGTAWGTIRTSTSQTSGKLYVEFSNSMTRRQRPPVKHCFWVFRAQSGFVSTVSYLGSSNYSAGMALTSGGNYASSGFTDTGNKIAAAVQPASGEVWALAIDFAAGKIWLARNNVWQGQTIGDPGAGTAPMVTFVQATVGALFAGISFDPPGTGVWTLQSTAASQKYAPAVRLQDAWDGGVAPPPTSVWSASDATANAMTLSNGGLTVTPSGALGLEKPGEPRAVWQSIRSSIGKTSGKLYVELSVPAGTTAYNWLFGLASSEFNAGGQIGNTQYSGGAWIQTGNPISAGFTSHYVSTLPPIMSLQRGPFMA